MIFATQKRKSYFDIDGNDINEVCKTKFLGVLIDNKLNWKDHIFMYRLKHPEVSEWW